MSVDGCESDADAARRFAGEIERLRAGLLRLGITEGPGPWPIPVDEWPVTTALAVLEERPGPVLNSAVLADETAQAVLTAHQRRDFGCCLCGWSELGKSHPGHQVAMLREAALLNDAGPAHAGQSSLG